MTTPSITHVAVTVTDLSVSVPWYEEVFEVAPVLDEDTGPFRHVVFPLGQTLLGLHQFPDPVPGSFDERRTGLDHVAFGAADRAELEAWEVRLEGLGVEHGKIVDAHYGSGIAFRDPDGIQLEIFAPPS